VDPGLVAGARAIPGAFGFLRGRRGLWPFCVVPLLLNLCVFGLAIAAFVAYLDPLVAAVSETFEVATPQAWYEWLWVGPLRLLAWALRWVLVALFALAVYFLFAVIGTVIASPFLDVLSARVESAVTGGAVAPGGGVLRALGAEARRVLFFLGVQLGWIALALVPGMQPFAVLGLFVSSALFLPLEYTSYLLDRRNIRFAERRAWLWSHRRAMFGFGATAFVSFLVPGLNFVCLPLLVTAGTRLALEIGPPTASLPAAG
jgi:CysZ protein